MHPLGIISTISNRFLLNAPQTLLIAPLLYLKNFKGAGGAVEWSAL